MGGSIIRVESASLKGVPESVSTDYTCHAWLSCSDALIVCTSNGDLIYCNEVG